MNKVLVMLYVPLIEKRYEIFIPISKKIGSVVKLLVKAVYELSDGHYPLEKESNLYNKKSGKKYDISITVKESDIRNDSEIILI